MAGWSYKLLAILTWCFAIAACDTREVSKTDAAQQLAEATVPTDEAEKQVAAFLAQLAPETRSEYDQQLPQAKAQIARLVEQAATHPDRTGRLAAFLTSNDKAGRALSQRIQEQMTFVKGMEEKIGGSSAFNASDLARHRKQLAAMLAEIEARRQAVQDVIKRDPVVAQAYAAWMKAPDGTVAQLVVRLKSEPCRRDWSDQQAVSGFLNFRGAAIGATEEQALRGLCEKNAGGVAVVSTKEGYTHGPTLLSQDHDLAGLGPIASQLSKPYRAAISYCLDCLPHDEEPGHPYRFGLSDTVKAVFSSNGQIIALERERQFIDRAQHNSPDAPRKLSLILPPLEKQFGKPSYMSQSEQVTRAVWIYPDRKSLIPQVEKSMVEGCLKPTYALDSLMKSGSQPPAGCGVVVTAAFYKDPRRGGRGDNRGSKLTIGEPADLNANIYWISMQIVDATAVRQQRNAAKSQVLQAAKMAADKLEERAKAPAGRAFQP